MSNEASRPPRNRYVVKVRQLLLSERFKLSVVAELDNRVTRELTDAFAYLLEDVARDAAEDALAEAEAGGTKEAK